MAGPVPTKAKPIAELIGGTLDPLMRKRGLAKADILRWWPEIVGSRYAGLTAPERIRWPRNDGERAATLIVHADPSVALPLSYELEGVRDRLNAFLGFRAVGVVKLVQRPFASEPKAVPRPAGPQTNERLETKLATVDGPLRDSLRALGRAILARS
ncbi:DciA family protein [Afifella sp. JA880]|uniref:DUF721 domain-containing protein n=1 Tax=Afifella sp. JA880 TaxID=2975280 RepID=UPI0021BB0E42|nr:DciA family protein [Afifella sp. JA880]MCT8266961.1 DciA family protein [Afifella sp. JA880]